MPRQVSSKTVFMLGSAVAVTLSGVAVAQDFAVPSGDLKRALDVYRAQAGVPLVVSSEAIKGVQSAGVKGDLSPDGALSRILSGTGFTAHRDPSGIVAVVRENRSSLDVQPMQLAQASPPRQAVETVTVTSSKLGGADVQSIPISITALSQEQLTATQTAGGPDLIKQVPNMTFTKTNFSGYSIQIRGIGTQAISVTTDPAVAVAFNDMPFIRNHFFEQEFYDVSQVAVLRGPQGTLYGRNATAGVVNLTSAPSTDVFEAKASAELGNYHQRRFEGMINLPIVDDRLAVRVAGEWTKRQGYSFNEVTDGRIDGRDLWSGRVTIGVKPIENLQAYLIWEHFQEDDDRIRSSKQLCKTAPIPTEINGVAVPAIGTGNNVFLTSPYLSQGCLPTSLYSNDAFEVPNGFSLPYYLAPAFFGLVTPGVDPYASTTQSRNLRVIESTIDPGYKVKNDILQLNVDYKFAPELTFTSQTGFSHDFLWSTQDYNRFNTAPGIFVPNSGDNPVEGGIQPNGFFCDPQLGCANRIVAQDLSTEHSWQLNQEFRLASNFAGLVNFNVGGNYLHYETAENYYVFINSLTLFVTRGACGWPDPSSAPACLPSGAYQYPVEGQHGADLGAGAYIDANPIASLDNNGHNYFLSQNPYALNSYALFGEAYYQIADDVKLTGGLRWTKDQKHFSVMPSWLLGSGWGYPVTDVVNQQWDQFTGRLNVTWTPKLTFTDQTSIYGSFARGYKAGGANPPGAQLLSYFGTGETLNPIHPKTFEPEFVNAFEVGTKNTLLDGALTLNSGAFYYDYKGYQISEIVDRSAINRNFNAKVKGAEIEAVWEPAPGLRFNLAGGWEDTALAKGSRAVDLIDRADLANHPDWMVMKPFATQSSNCILPTYVVAAIILAYGEGGEGNPATNSCGTAYGSMNDPVTNLPYVGNPTQSSGVDGGPMGCGNGALCDGGIIPPGYIGFDPRSAPNNGQGFFKDLSGNQLPNAPPYTVSFGAQYTVPISSDWAGTLRSDYYWQDYSWARVFNDNPYDRLRGYTSVNLTLIFTSQNGWQVMLYDKNVFNTTAITGTFLNSDDSGLTTNVFLTDPKLIGVRVTKNW